jgi:UDP-N-acetylmuramate dehydrogenase
MCTDIKISTKLRGKLLQKELLSKYTTWRVGGAAEYFYKPKNLEDLAQFLNLWPNHHQIMWLGGGSNVLIRDAGIKATIIHTPNNLNKIALANSISENTVRVEAGVSCAKLVQFCLQQNLIDCAFLAGIPGTIGGALTMNAGAFGDEIWQHIALIETINRFGVIKIQKPQEFNIGYRHIAGLQPNEWFVAGYLQFKSGNVTEARKKIQENWKNRLSSQPIKEFTCGSVFKNPKNNFAGQLIEQSGLKNAYIGGAKVSNKHANFIINTGNATATNIEKLMQLITNKVFKKHAIRLEPEVKILGR